MILVSQLKVCVLKVLWSQLHCDLALLINAKHPLYKPMWDCESELQCCVTALCVYFSRAVVDLASRVQRLPPWPAGSAQPAPNVLVDLEACR